VDGRGNGAVQSFFGAVRDGGRRDHHGIDIFAPRGTPVLAATDGVVRSTRPNRLGGNVVWLADADRGQSLYYAHLDSHNVSAGQRVRRGDTVGFIGNSGNARTTSPHLHFGIYRRGQGPVDPWPYVRRVTATPPRIRADTGRLGGSDTVRTRVAIRTSPAASAPTTQQLGRNTPLRIMGAASSWYRVLLDNGVAGYVPAAQLR
jgi:peptidoglycan LD-endopeptidase LytH